jgi:hypothetical protein
VTVLLVNLLIAMMGNTYSEIASIKNEWMRQVPGLFLFFSLVSLSRRSPKVAWDAAHKYAKTNMS